MRGTHQTEIPLCSYYICHLLKPPIRAAETLGRLPIARGGLGWARLPSQLGSAWFHWWFLSQTRGSSSLSVYPGSQLKVTVDRTPKVSPCRRPFTGMPGSRQESDSSVTPGPAQSRALLFCARASQNRPKYTRSWFMEELSGPLYL